MHCSESVQVILHSSYVILFQGEARSKAYLQGKYANQKYIFIKRILLKNIYWYEEDAPECTETAEEEISCYVANAHKEDLLLCARGDVAITLQLCRE